MKLKVDQKIFKKYPDFKIGVVVLKGINNSKRVSSVENLLRGICAQKKSILEKEDIENNTMIQPWIDAFTTFNINYKKYPPSILALLQRMKSGKEIPHINVLVDLYNYFSIKHTLPIGGEDLDWVHGDIQLGLTKGGEAFRPIASVEVKKAKEGEVAYMDKGGITARHWNYRECERTKFTNKTQNALILFEDISKMHLDEFAEIIKDFKDSAEKYIGGQIAAYIITEENNTIDLGIKGLSRADDSIIPKQEQAHFISKNKHTKTKKIIEKKETEKQDLESDKLNKKIIEKLLSEALKKAFPETKQTIHIEYPSSSEHGDYAANIALRLVKEIGGNPREIAKKIINSISENKIVDKAEIAGPGFINIFISKNILEEELEKIIVHGDNYGQSSIGVGKKIIVEYSAPNIAKPLGVHHLLSTIIGQTTYNTYKKLGFETISINHIGDWGTQFGKLIVAYKKWGKQKTVEANPIPELLKLYIKFHNEAEENSELDDKARLEFKKFEDGDQENKELWQWFVDESMKDIDKSYKKLGGIHFDYTQGESFYEDKMPEIIKKGKEKGIIIEGEQGALVIHFKDEKYPTVPVQKKDGATLYFTRDLATLKYRIKTWHPQKILYVVDIAQKLHFQQVFETGRMLGISQNQAEHIPFGRMSMKDGNMSTRKGNIVLLNDVIDEAEKRAKELLKAKNNTSISQKDLAKIIGVGAVKYSILSQNRNTNIVFDWDKMLSLDGNSGPYLQYTYARAQSILRKAKENLEYETKDENLENSEKLTQELVRLFPKFGEYIASSAREYKSNIISSYIYELAQKFNTFYNSVPVLKTKDPELKKQRIKIVKAAAQIIKNGLNLLGVEVVEKM